MSVSPEYMSAVCAGNVRLHKLWKYGNPSHYKDCYETAIDDRDCIKRLEELRNGVMK